MFFKLVGRFGFEKSFAPTNGRKSRVFRKIYADN